MTSLEREKTKKQDENINLVLHVLDTAGSTNVGKKPMLQKGGSLIVIVILFLIIFNTTHSPYFITFSSENKFVYETTFTASPGYFVVVIQPGSRCAKGYFVTETW